MDIIAALNGTNYEFNNFLQKNPLINGDLLVLLHVRRKFPKFNDDFLKKYSIGIDKKIEMYYRELFTDDYRGYEGYSAYYLGATDCPLARILYPCIHNSRPFGYDGIDICKYIMNNLRPSCELLLNMYFSGIPQIKQYLISNYRSVYIVKPLVWDINVMKIQLIKYVLLHTDITNLLVNKFIQTIIPEFHNIVNEIYHA